MKENKGITLVALTITIIVLIIIAAVTIRQVTNRDIVTEAQNVREQYLAVQDKEEGEIQDTANFIREIKDQAKADEGSTGGVILTPKTTYQFTVENVGNYEVDAGTTWEQFANASNGVYVLASKGIEHTTLGRVRLGERAVVRTEEIQDGAVYHCGTTTVTEPETEPQMITFTVAGIEYQVVQGTTWREFAATNENFQINQVETTSAGLIIYINKVIYQGQYKVVNTTASATAFEENLGDEVIQSMSYVLMREESEFSDI